MVINGARSIAFSFLFAWIVIPPALHHAFGLRRPFLRDWGMMGNAGVPLREAQYFLVKDGVWRKLDAGPLLPPRPASGNHAAVLRTDGEVVSIARQFCSQAGPGADIRIRSRRGERRGWTPEHNGDKNVCAD